MKQSGLMLVVVGMLLMGSQPVYANDTFHTLGKKVVKVLHVSVHILEDVVDFTMAPVHAILNALGEPVEE